MMVGEVHKSWMKLILKHCRKMVITQWFCLFFWIPKKKITITTGELSEGLLVSFISESNDVSRREEGEESLFLLSGWDVSHELLQCGLVKEIMKYTETCKYINTNSLHSHTLFIPVFTCRYMDYF